MDETIIDFERTEDGKYRYRIAQKVDILRGILRKRASLTWTSLDSIEAKTPEVVVVDTAADVSASKPQSLVLARSNPPTADHYAVGGEGYAMGLGPVANAKRFERATGEQRKTAAWDLALCVL